MILRLIITMLTRIRGYTDRLLDCCGVDSGVLITGLDYLDWVLVNWVREMGYLLWSCRLVVGERVGRLRNYLDKSEVQQTGCRSKTGQNRHDRLTQYSGWQGHHSQFHQTGSLRKQRLG